MGEDVRWKHCGEENDSPCDIHSPCDILRHSFISENRGTTQFLKDNLNSVRRGQILRRSVIMQRQQSCVSLDDVQHFTIVNLYSLSYRRNQKTYVSLHLTVQVPTAYIQKLIKSEDDTRNLQKGKVLTFKTIPLLSVLLSAILNYRQEKFKGIPLS